MATAVRQFPCRFATVGTGDLAYNDGLNVAAN